MSTSPSFWKAMPSWMSACVPTAMRARPDSTASRARRFPLPGPATGDQRHVHGRRAEQPSERRVVLGGEDLRRGHQRHLPAVLDRQRRGDHGHRRLAGAHVPLQQPVHRLGPGHVAADLRHRAGLGTGEGERQEAPGPGEPIAVHVKGDARLVLDPLAPEREAEVQQEQLVEGEPPVRRAPLRLEGPEVVVRRRLVDAGQRLGQRRQGEALAEVRRERVLHRPEVRRGHPGDQRADLPLLVPLEPRVHRDDAAGVE